MMDNGNFTSSTLPAFDQYDFAKELDFFNYPSDVLAPHPDLFESELDSDLAAIPDLEFHQLQHFTVDNDTSYYLSLRSDTPTCGPPSTLTVSSESYDSLSSHSESFYNFPTSPYPASNYSNALDFEMDFQRIRVDSVPDYAVNPTQTNSPVLSSDPTSFGTLPPTPPHSPPVPSVKSFDTRAFSDYGPSSTRIGAPDYFSQLSFSADNMAHSTISPSRVTSQLPIAAQSIPLVRPSSDDGLKGGDPRKKYKCNVCPRGTCTFSSQNSPILTKITSSLRPSV
jgi:hypothetical protein